MMKKQNINSSDALIFRQKAEKLLKKKSLKTDLQLSEAEMLKLIKELQVHQKELELQNEKLALAKELAEVAAEKYSELYDFAPSGYLTFSKEGKIIELNLSGASMLGKQRPRLINSQFGSFVSDETKPIFNLFLGKVFNSKAKESCEVTLSGANNLPIYVSLTGIMLAEEGHCLVNMIDVTNHRKIEETQLFLLSHNYSDTKENFFESLARYLALTLDVDYVCIDKLQGDLLSAQTVAIYFDGKFEDNVAYTLKETPCGDVVGKTICCFPKGVRHLFLKDIVLQEMLAESYIGTTLNSYTGQPIGIIALISRKPLKNQYLAESILKLAAIRASGELERKKADESLKQLNEELEDHVKERTAELLKSNASLRKTEEKFRTIAEYTYDWEFWLDQNDIMLYCSPSCERITGYNATEFLINPGLFFDIIHPDDQKAFYCHKKNEDKTKDAILEIHYRIVRFDGTIRWIGHVCQSLYNESGKFTGIRGSNRDITVRKSMEQLLKISNQKYKLLSENITDGIFIYRNGYFEYFNKAMNHIFGYNDRELDGLKVSLLAMPDYRNALEEVLSLNTSFNQHRIIEIECSKKNHSIVFVEILINYRAKERVIYGVVRNITEKKEIQKNIIKAIIKTEEKERAYYSKELHDGLGPLLSTIKLYLQWATRPKSNKSREEVIHKAEDILGEALATVKEISNKLSPHLLIYYGLTSAIQSFADRLAESSAIRIVFKSNAGRRLDIEIEAALYRAIIECINNTVKHARANNITITLNDSGSQLQLEYRDDGIGFDLTETRSTQKGLGLFNLQNRIQTIGGKITMFSKPGYGVYYQIIVNL